MIAYPIQGKPGYYAIEEFIVGPDFVFSTAKSRLKGNPYKRAKAFVIAESQRTRSALVCELGEHYVDEMTSEVHHRINRSYHVAKGLGLACHNHNAAHGAPAPVPPGPSETVEREKTVGVDVLTGADIAAAPVVVKLNTDLYPVFCRYLKDETEGNKEIQVKDIIAGGAKFMRKQTGHGSPQSARNYLDMETSEEGEYEVVEAVVRRKAIIKTILTVPTPNKEEGQR